MNQTEAEQVFFDISVFAPGQVSPSGTKAGYFTLGETNIRSVRDCWQVVSLLREELCRLRQESCKRPLGVPLSFFTLRPFG